MDNVRSWFSRTFAPTPTSSSMAPSAAAAAASPTAAVALPVLASPPPVAAPRVIAAALPVPPTKTEEFKAFFKDWWNNWPEGIKGDDYLRHLFYNLKDYIDHPNRIRSWLGVYCYGVYCNNDKSETFFRELKEKATKFAEFVTHFNEHPEALEVKALTFPEIFALRSAQGISSEVLVSLACELKHRIFNAGDLKTGNLYCEEKKMLKIFHGGQIQFVLKYGQVTAEERPLLLQRTAPEYLLGEIITEKNYFDWLANQNKSLTSQN